jgi:hypothetical protein
MKKYFFVIACLMASQVLIAQHQPNFGLKAGVNLASLRGENDNTDSKVGFHVGGLAHIHLSKRWALQPELLFSSQGGKTTVLNTKSTLSLNYINLPVLVQFMFDNGFRLQAGPQLGFLVSAENKIGNVESDVKDNYKTLDFSIPIGLGYLTSSGFGVDARWVPGIIDIPEGEGKLKNNVFQFSLFYQFNGSRHKTKG